MSTHTRLITAAAFLLLASTELRAAVVTSGFATIGPNIGSGTFAFYFDDFPPKGGHLYTGNWELFSCYDRCPVGTSLGAHGLIGGGDIDGGGNFEFFGPPVILLPGIVYGDFTFNGEFCFGNDCEFGTRPLTGSGRVKVESELGLFPFYSDKILVQRITYVFNPIPEPSFAPMIALGLTALILRNRFRNSFH